LGGGHPGQSFGGRLATSDRFERHEYLARPMSTKTAK